MTSRPVTSFLASEWEVSMADYVFNGRCRCGQSEYQVALPAPLCTYVPRTCDCDFCQLRNIAYLSDPKGTAVLTSSAPFTEQKQGSEQARFLSCSHCNDVLAATCVINDTLRGAVNAARLTDDTDLKPAESASPKRLSADDKRTRWAQLWLHLTIQIDN